jgi:hypothetical protein
MAVGEGIWTRGWRQFWSSGGVAGGGLETNYSLTNRFNSLNTPQEMAPEVGLAPTGVQYQILTSMTFARFWAQLKPTLPLLCLADRQRTG